MGEVLTIVGALLPFALSELQTFKVVSPNISALITGIEGAGAAFITELTNTTSGKVTVTAVSLLGGISAAISVLQAQTTIDPAGLAITKALGIAITAGLTAVSITSVDVSKLQPIAPVA